MVDELRVFRFEQALDSLRSYIYQICEDVRFVKKFYLEVVYVKKVFLDVLFVKKFYFEVLFVKKFYL